MKHKTICTTVILVLLLVFSTASVSAWSATRSISTNTVTINIDPSNSEGVFTLQETLAGATVTTKPGTCGYDVARRVLTCNYDQNIAGTVVYETTGSGTVSGTITGRSVGALSSTTQDIMGDTVIPSGTVAQCNNNIVESPETCDDGNQVTETCAYGDVDGCLVCDASCQSVAGATSYCGDGAVNAVNGEQCDDSNTASEDGCSATCTTEGGAAVCGNNVREGVELCDGADLGGATCASDSAAGPGSTGTLACYSGTCNFDTTGCGQAELPPATCPPTCPITISGANVIEKRDLAQCIVQAIDDNAGVLQRITGIARCLRDSPLFP